MRHGPAILLALSLTLALSSVPGPSPARAASFDCARATAADERAVCADPRLSELDSALGAAYDQARRGATAEDRARLMAAARAFLAGRRSCGTDRACLLSAYAGGIAGYGRYGSAVQVPPWVNALDMAGGGTPKATALPQLAGQCATTRVAQIGARLEGEPPGSFQSGTSVEFANGGHQVSYEREEAIVASRPGDSVVMCLISVPRDCPAGDVRGRIYTATNLRTRGTWSLPDAQHSCGGA